MDVTDEAVALGHKAQMIQNLGPDELYVAPREDVDEDNGFAVYAGQAVALGYSNGGVWCVSAGTSDVRMLDGATGIFTVVEPA